MTVALGSFRLTSTAPGAAATPADLDPGARFVAAPVPGTVARALADAGLYTVDDPAPLHDADHWYLGTIEGEGALRIVFEGLATLCDVFVGGALVLSSDHMFARHEVVVDLSGRTDLALCFRALAPRLAQKGPRARWKTGMIPNQGLRLVRTTTIGQMPGWCPAVEAVGPFRPIRIEPASTPRIRPLRLMPDFDGTAGSLDAVIAVRGAVAPPRLSCAGGEVVLAEREPGIFAGRLDGLAVAPWWPNGFGDQPLHPVTLSVDRTLHELGRTGFRRIEADRGADGRGFGLRVNGRPVFCRGAVWTSADVVGLSGTRAAYEPVLRLARDAGMTMIRVSGTMLYESPDFFALCDEFGLMVWQDFAFANFDYPVKDPAFVAAVRREAAYFCAATAGAPSLAVLCGGSETMQQGAMMGLPESAWRSPLFTDVLAEAAADHRPDAVYVENSPSGGALPFLPNVGVGHYYGVGAYCRPLEDARRAGVRFAGECLAFANAPEQATLDRHLAVPPVHHPRWKAATPRDLGASWDFEDVRDHYLALLYGVDPVRLRREDVARYLDLARATTAEVMEATFAEWRRAASPCRGALVFTLQDLVPGAGWGVVDAVGAPKAAYFALARAFRPLQLTMTDEGTNGLALHLLNETGELRPVTLSLAALREGAAPVVRAACDLDLAAGAALEIGAFELLGAFFDFTYAYRFGPPAHDVVVARLTCRDSGALLADAFHFPGGRGADRRDCGLAARLEEDGDGFALTISCTRLAQSVHVVDADFRGSDGWFHLAPGEERRLRLLRRPDAAEGARPRGEVAAVNARDIARYGGWPQREGGWDGPPPPVVVASGRVPAHAPTSRA